MPIYPVCKIYQPSLNIGGTCSWKCKGLQGKTPPTPSKPTPPARIVVKPPPTTMRSFFAGQTRKLVAVRRQNHGNKLFYHAITRVNPLALRPYVYVQDYFSRNKGIQIKGKVIVNYPVDTSIRSSTISG